jgi:hypothetical protein
MEQVLTKLYYSAHVEGHTHTVKHKGGYVQPVGHMRISTALWYYILHLMPKLLLLAVPMIPTNLKPCHV